MMGVSRALYDHIMHVQVTDYILQLYMNMKLYTPEPVFQGSADHP